MDLAYVFAFGPGILAQQAKFLIRSLERNTSASEMYAFTTTEELPKISDEILDLVRTSGTLLVGEMPLQDYPISAKQQAAVVAEEKTDCSYLCCLDTDTVVFNDPTPSENLQADLYVKPVDIGAQGWASQESFREWEDICKQWRTEFPGFITMSTVDKQPIPPYWNTGVTIMKTIGISQQWLSITKDLIETRGTGYFTDQIALGALSNKYDVEELGEVDNYPLTHRVYTPSSVNILHYNEMVHLLRLYHPRVAKEMYDLGMKSALFSQMRQEGYKPTVRDLGRVCKRRWNHIRS